MSASDENPMEFFQIILSSIFSIIGAGSILFVASRAYTVGVDVAEMKELIKEIRREAQHRADIGGVPAAPAAIHAELGNWPSVTDPRYDANPDETLPYALRPAEDRDRPSAPNRPRSW